MNALLGGDEREQFTGHGVRYGTGSGGKPICPEYMIIYCDIPLIFEYKTTSNSSY